MRDATEIFYTVVLASVFFVVLTVVIVVAIWRYYSRKRQHELSVLQFDHTLLQTKMEIQEQTFRSISQELHDNSGQLLSLANLHLKTISFDKPAQAKEKLDDATTLISRTIQSLRDLAKNLHSESVLRAGLIAALEAEVRMIEKIGTLQPVFRIGGVPYPMQAEHTLIIFRIVQEALHNVVKHSRATVVEVEIDFSIENIKLIISDNGIGTPAGTFAEGSGLRNMKDRAKVMGGNFKLNSSADTGTTITVTIPHLWPARLKLD